VFVCSATATSIVSVRPPRSSSDFLVNGRPTSSSAHITARTEIVSVFLDFSSLWVDLLERRADGIEGLGHHLKLLGMDRTKGELGSADPQLPVT
jgi:hypothetical protein